MSGQKNNHMKMNEIVLRFFYIQKYVDVGQLDWAVDINCRVKD